MGRGKPRVEREEKASSPRRILGRCASPSVLPRSFTFRVRMFREYHFAMVDPNPLVAQGGMGEALLRLMPVAGVLVVPVSIGSWWLWAIMCRPRSRVAIGWLVTISLLLRIWVVGFISYWNMPSVEEEMAVEEVESAYPALGSSTWNYSANHRSRDVWIISVAGHTQAGQPISETFRVSPCTVEEERSGTPSGWVILKQWPLPGPTTSQPTSRP